jgi:hypothetical protein
MAAYGAFSPSIARRRTVRFDLIPDIARAQEAEELRRPASEGNGAYRTGAIYGRGQSRSPEHRALIRDLRRLIADALARQVRSMWRRRRCGKRWPAFCTGCRVSLPEAAHTSALAGGTRPSSMAIAARSARSMSSGSGPVPPAVPRSNFLPPGTRPPSAAAHLTRVNASVAGLRFNTQPLPGEAAMVIPQGGRLGGISRSADNQELLPALWMSPPGPSCASGISSEPATPKLPPPPRTDTQQ